MDGPLAGAAPRAVDAELAGIARRLEQAHPALNRGRGLFVRAGAVLMGAVSLVLLIAAANVSSLLLARAAARRTEISMRLALGASRGRVLRQRLTESTLLVLVGGAVGCILALWAREILWSVRPPFLENTPLERRMDRRVLFFTAAALGLTGLLTGLAPALRLLLVQTLQPVAAGLLLGGVLALLASRLVGALLYGLAGTEPASFLAAAILAALAALVCVVPAGRALRVDPAIALRSS